MELEHKIPLSAKFYSQGYNILRRQKGIRFGNILSKYADFTNLPAHDQLKFVVKMERSCFNSCVRRCQEAFVSCNWDEQLFINTYHSVCAKIFWNIDPDSSVKHRKLGEALLTLNIKTLPDLSETEMYPEKNAETVRHLEERRQTTVTEKTTSLYICGKCKKNQCVYRNHQNRSGDESITLAVRCVNCNHSWYS